MFAELWVSGMSESFEHVCDLASPKLASASKWWQTANECSGGVALVALHLLLLDAWHRMWFTHLLGLNQAEATNSNTCIYVYCNKRTLRYMIVDRLNSLDVSIATCCQIWRTKVCVLNAWLQSCQNLLKVPENTNNPAIPELFYIKSNGEKKLYIQL